MMSIKCIAVTLLLVLEFLHEGSGAILGSSPKVRNPRSFKSKIKSILKFQKKPEGRINLEAFETTVVECSVRSHPPAVIHWLKDGHRITNNTYDMEKRINSVVRSLDVDSSREMDGVSERSLIVYKLVIPCAESSSAGIYSCVAENGFDRLTTETNVRVHHTNNVWPEDSELLAEPKYCSQEYGNMPKIDMWSDSLVAIEGSTIRLLCRSTGSPRPKVSWFIEGSPSDQLVKIHNSRKYHMLNNGDLIIADLSWESDMGQFKCRAENSFGSDDVSIFVYAVAK